MPRGIPVDRATIRAKLQEVKAQLANGAPSKAQAIRAAGISVSNFNKWSKRFPQFLQDRPPATSRTPGASRAARSDGVARAAQKRRGRRRRRVIGVGPAPVTATRSPRVQSESAELTELRALVVEQALENRVLRRQLRR